MCIRDRPSTSLSNFSPRPAKLKVAAPSTDVCDNWSITVFMSLSDITKSAKKYAFLNSFYINNFLILNRHSTVTVGTTNYHIGPLNSTGKRERKCQTQSMVKHLYVRIKLQRDRATRFSVEILQLQNIPFENDCNRQMTLKFIHLKSSQFLYHVLLLACCYSVSSTVYSVPEVVANC